MPYAPLSPPSRSPHERKRQAQAILDRLTAQERDVLREHFEAEAESDVERLRRLLDGGV